MNKTPSDIVETLIAKAEVPTTESLINPAPTHEWKEIKMAEGFDLPDGEYRALRYGSILEVKGKKYTTEDGIRSTRIQCGGPKAIKVSEGKVTVRVALRT